MKRYIKLSSSVAKHQDCDISDKIIIDIDINLPPPYLAASTSIIAGQFAKFPGVVQFKEDVARILQNEYNFEIADSHISNRKDSVSVYFDTYFDIANAKDVVRKFGIKDTNIPSEGKVFCYIHIRFSDHTLSDMGDIHHRNYLKRNADKFVKERNEVTHVLPEQEIELQEKDLHYYYNDAIDDLRTQLELKMVYWCKYIDRWQRNKD